MRLLHCRFSHRGLRRRQRCRKKEDIHVPTQTHLYVCVQVYTCLCMSTFSFVYDRELVKREKVAGRTFRSAVVATTRNEKNPDVPLPGHISYEHPGMDLSIDTRMRVLTCVSAVDFYTQRQRSRQRTARQHQAVRNLHTRDLPTKKLIHVELIRILGLRILPVLLH